MFSLWAHNTPEPLSFHACDGMSVHIRSSTAKRSTYDGTLKIVTPNEYILDNEKNQLPNIMVDKFQQHSKHAELQFSVRLRSAQCFEAIAQVVHRLLR